MKDVSIVDSELMRLEMIQMYKKIGLTGSLQCLYEILYSANLLMEVIIEENKKL